MTVDLEALYLEHEPRVRWIMHARGIDAGSVDDLVHESFMTIHRRWAQRDRTVPVATWVTGVARNVAFSYRRAEARRQRRLRGMPERPTEPPPDETVAEREAWQELEAFARELSPKLREVFVLADVGGMPVSEIAETSGVPVATLHSRLRLARRRFAAHFGSRRDAEGRGAMLRRAAAEQTPSSAARRRSLALLMASVKVPSAAVPIAAGASSKVTGWVVAVVVVGIGGMVAVDQSLDQSPERIEPRQRAPVQVASIPERPPAERGSRHAPTEPPPSPSRRRPPSRHRDLPRGNPPHRPVRVSRPPLPRDRLAVHVAALERARTLVKSGSFAAALAALDRVEILAPAIVRDHHRLARRAACAAEREDRARSAAQALADLGLSIDVEHPCPRGDKSQ